MKFSSDNAAASIRRPKKSLGQHFLRCAWVAEAMIGSAEITSRDMALEIGPGEGALTRALARTAGRVIAVEKDERLAQKLETSLAQENIGNVEIIAADILVFLLDSRFLILDSPYKVVANIPYYLTSHLIRLLLKAEPRPERIVLAIQREVAERIIAKAPRTNLLALSVQAFGLPEIAAIIPKSCFSPQPSVDSAILKISGISDAFFTKNDLKPAAFFHLVRAAFGQKRKILCSALAPFIPKTRCQEILENLGLSPKSRPQELSLEHWAALAEEREANNPSFLTHNS